jgi:hypothetical protein
VSFFLYSERFSLQEVAQASLKLPSINPAQPPINCARFFPTTANSELFSPLLKITMFFLQSHKRCSKRTISILGQDSNTKKNKKKNKKKYVAIRMFSSVLLLGADCLYEVSRLVLYQYTRLLLFHMSSSDPTLGIFY